MNLISIILGNILNFINSLYILNFQLFKNKNFIKYFLYLIKIQNHSKKNINKIYKNQKFDLKKLMNVKKTKEIFIFGSGYSLKNISNKEWKKIRNYDSIGFNNTIFLRKINFTYHLNRRLPNSNKNIKDQLNQINRNPYLKKTVFLMPEGFVEQYTNNIFSKKLWNKKKIFFYLKQIN